jgi:hypothetical protein
MKSKPCGKESRKPPEFDRNDLHEVRGRGSVKEKGSGTVDQKIE